jgi:flagellin-specific chaperone FliS
MSFKHGNFEDSAVLRSLERYAKENGMVRPEEFVKKAEKKIDLKPSENLTDNLIKLCNGLRDQGLESFANDIENNFLNYKTAEAKLYAETDGEKLVEQAHPKGSPKLDVLGDGVVETILDQHLAMIKMVDKKPTGKLNGKLKNATEIINAVKIALANSDANLLNAHSNIKKAKNIIKGATSTVQKNNFNKLADIVLNMIQETDNVNDVNELIKIRDAISNLFNAFRESSGWGKGVGAVLGLPGGPGGAYVGSLVGGAVENFGGNVYDYFTSDKDDEKFWKKAYGLVLSAKNDVEKAISIYKSNINENEKETESKSKIVETSHYQPVINAHTKVITWIPQIAASTKLPQQQKTSLITWCNAMIAELSRLLNAFNKQEFDEVIGGIVEFEKDWLPKL